MKIRQIIDKIDENQLFVPAFQREYVWKRTDAKNLISSLIKDYPTGTMLTWETNNPPELKGRFKYDQNKGSVKIILDGQQRITTLYMLMKGEIPPYYSEKEIENDVRNLYVNLETNELEYYKVKTMENNPLWGIEDRDFVEQIIPVKATIKEAIDIFYIVNASGVNLTDAELALAQICGYWPNARDLFKKKIQELENQGWVFKLDFIVYALLAVVHKLGSKMEKLHTADNNEKLREAWKILDEHVLDYTCNLLQSQAFVDHTDEINSVYALIPIIAYTFNKSDHKLNEEEIKKIIKWFYYSQIRYRYVSQLPQKLDKDLGIINDNPNPFETLLALIDEERPLEIKPSEFIGRDIRHPLFSLMKWYFKSKGAVCFGTGLSLRKNMGKRYSLERDHIFAYSVLRDSGIYDMGNQFHYAIAQEITNRAILTSSENREKSAMFAHIYLKQVKKEFPNALKLQCIPENEDLWTVENYELFLETRRKILATELNTYLQNISIGTSLLSASVDLFDMIASGEHGFLEFKSTMRWNWRENRLDKKMEEIILKTISAFANAEGGKLLIGVTDDGELLGLELDYNTMKEGNKDHFELHLRNIVNHAFGKNFGAINMRVRFPIINDVEICEIDIKPTLNPIYLTVPDRNGVSQKKFFIRSGNTSQELDIAESAAYIQKRFS